MPVNKQKNQKNQKENPIKANDIPETSSIRAIKYLTCQGGGIKGVGDIGAVKELERCGVLAQIEEVAGSSAGSIVAALIAIGCTAEEIKKEMLSLDFESFKDKDVGWLESTRIKDFAKGGEWIAKSITEKVNFLKQIPLFGNVIKEAAKPIEGPVGSAASVLGGIGTAVDYLEKAEDIAGVALGTDLGLWKGDVLRNAIATVIARKTGKPNITFRELEALTKIEGSQFKGLTVTGSNLTTGKLEYYNAKLTPDMAIADAVRISASVPGAFKPVIMDGQVKVDGGLLENLPDVFNKEPYVTAENLNKFGGNPQVFALSFVEPHEHEPKKIKNGIDVVKACFSAKLSEGALHKKYGDNIAHIDTLGVDFLDFKLSADKTEALANSGATAVRNVFKTILEKEKTKKEMYQGLSLNELLRRECALQHLSQKQKTPSIREQINKIKRAIDEKEIPEDRLEKLRKQAEASFVRKQALLDPKSMSDKTLADRCLAKRKEVERIEGELRNKLKYLHLSKNALEFNRAEILARYKSNYYNNDFYHDLHKLKQMEENIDSTPNKKDYQPLITKRDHYIDNLIRKYKSKKDDLLADFFGDIKEDSKNLNFKVPYTAKKIWKYCDQDIQSCLSFMHECKDEIEKTKREYTLFDQYSAGFSERTSKSEKFSALMQLKESLDNSIDRKTTLLTKLDAFVMHKAPKFARVLKPFLKMAAFCSFVFSLPVAAPAVGIAKLIGHFSKSAETKSTLDRFVDFFRWTDLDLSTKLQGLRNTTAECIKKLNENYLKADKVEHSYVHRLHANFLKNSGVALEDVFSKKIDETPEQFNKRLDRIKKSFEVEKSTERVLKEDLLNKRANKKLSDFKAEVLKEVLRKTEPKPTSFIHKVKLAKAEVTHIRHENVKLIHLEFLNRMDQTLNADKEAVLSKNDFKQYIDSSNFLGRELSQDFNERHADYLSKRSKAAEPSKPELGKPGPGKPGPGKQPLASKDVKENQEELEVREALTLFMKERKSHLGAEKGKLEPVAHKPAKPKKGREKH